MEIPWSMLDPSTLNRLIEEFVTRDGTDMHDASSKIKQVLEHLKNGTAHISFDAETKTCTLFRKNNP